MNVIHLSTLGTRWAVWHVPAQERGVSGRFLPCSASQGTSGEGLGGFHTLCDWNYPLMKAGARNQVLVLLCNKLKPASARYFPDSYSPQLQKKA